MITPADTNAFITDIDEQDDNGKINKYRKLSFKVDVTNPELPFSTCKHDGIKSKGKNHNLWKKLVIEFDWNNDINIS